MATETTAMLEARVWFRCTDADELHRFACWMAEEWPGHDGERPDPPEPHYRFFITGWPYKGRGEPWKNTYLNGLNQASLVAHRAAEAGINVEVFAIRVQADDSDDEFPAATAAVYPPATPEGENA